MKLSARRHVSGCPCRPLPCYLIGDEIFSLKSWLVKPFAGKITEEQPVYNYRRSRPRHIIENSFGILSARWQIFSKLIKANVENVENYGWAAICLHIYLHLMENATYSPTGFVDRRSSLQDIRDKDWQKK